MNALNGGTIGFGTMLTAASSLTLAATFGSLSDVPFTFNGGAGDRKDDQYYPELHAGAGNNPDGSPQHQRHGHEQIFLQSRPASGSAPTFSSNTYNFVSNYNGGSGEIWCCTSLATMPPSQVWRSARAPDTRICQQDHGPHRDGSQRVFHHRHAGGGQFGSDRDREQGSGVLRRCERSHCPECGKQPDQHPGYVGGRDDDEAYSVGVTRQSSKGKLAADLFPRKHRHHHGQARTTPRRRTTASQT